MSATHEALDSLPAAADALGGKLGVYARATVRFLAHAVSSAYVNEESLVFPGSPTGLPLAPGVVARATYAESATHERERVLASVLLDACVLHRDSLAKYAAAFFRKSRSCLTSSNSRRSLRISSSWLVSLPWPGKTSAPMSPERLSACCFHLRSISERIPSSRATSESLLPSSVTSRTASSLNSRVNCRLFCANGHLPPQSYVGLISVSTKTGEFHVRINGKSMRSSVWC